MSDINYAVALTAYQNDQPIKLSTLVAKPIVGSLDPDHGQYLMWNDRLDDSDEDLQRIVNILENNDGKILIYGSYVVETLRASGIVFETHRVVNLYRENAKFLPDWAEELEMPYLVVEANETIDRRMYRTMLAANLIEQIAIHTLGEDIVS